MEKGSSYTLENAAVFFLGAAPAKPLSTRRSRNRILELKIGRASTANVLRGSDTARSAGVAGTEMGSLPVGGVLEISCSV
jgi:hypothetical protein